MKKFVKIFIILHACLLSCICSFSQNMNSEVIKARCEIVRIDSLRDYYIIYAKDSLVKYKMVSQKDSNANCRNVDVGGIYDFTFFRPLLSMNSGLDVYPGGAVIISYGWGRGLYEPLEMKGLCYNVKYLEDVVRRYEVLHSTVNAIDKRYRRMFIRANQIEQRVDSDTLYYETNPMKVFD